MRGGGQRWAEAGGLRRRRDDEKKRRIFRSRLVSGEKPVAQTGAFEFGFRPRVRDSTEGKNSRLRFLSISGFENSRANSKPPFERRLGGDEGSRRALSFMFLCECGSGMGGPGGGARGVRDRCSARKSRARGGEVRRCAFRRFTHRLDRSRRRRWRRTARRAPRRSGLLFSRTKGRP